MKAILCALAAVVAVGTVSRADAAIIFAINDGDNGLYSVDTSDGSADLLKVLGTFGGNSPNGLAHDVSGGAFYYTNHSNNPATLFKLDYSSTGLTGDASLWTIATVPVGLPAAALPGPNASGAFYAGHYYWWAQGTENPTTPGEDNGLFRINPLNGAITNILTANRGTFGDIEIRGDGRLYVSNDNSFAIYNLNTSALLTSIGQRRMQIAFGSDGILYGIQTEANGGFAAGSIFTINQNTGVRTFTGRTTALDVNDAARAVPEPGTLALLGFGLLALGFGLHRRKVGSRDGGPLQGISATAGA